MICYIVKELFRLTTESEYTWWHSTGKSERTSFIREMRASFQPSLFSELQVQRAGSQDIEIGTIVVFRTLRPFQTPPWEGLDGKRSINLIPETDTFLKLSRG